VRDEYERVSDEDCATTFICPTQMNAANVKTLQNCVLITTLPEAEQPNNPASRGRRVAPLWCMLLSLKQEFEGDLQTPGAALLILRRDGA
jgi:hypothetical protein